MLARDDFEHRLSQGLKRWAEAGRPTLDLAAHVTGQRRRRSWLRWAAGFVATAAALAGLALSFPRWAGAAQGWPFIGPVVNEFLVRDAGLKAVYDSGMLKGVLAEASDGPITVRILGVAADRVGTVVLYQITGVMETPGLDLWWNRPRGDGLWERLYQAGRYTWPVKVRANVRGIDWVDSSSMSASPFGIFGTIWVPPAEGPDMQVTFETDGRTLTVQVPVSRTEADRLTKEIPLNQTREIGGIAYTVETIIETPSVVAVRWKVAKSSFPEYFSRPQLELEPGIFEAIRVFPDGDYRVSVFRNTGRPVRVIIKDDVKGVPGNLTWPLTRGAVQEIDGRPVTLTDWLLKEGQLLAEWTYQPKEARIVSFGGFEVVDAAGQAYPLTAMAAEYSGHPDFPRTFAYRFPLPAGAVPAAVRSTLLAEAVKGPWVFEIPRQ